MAFRYRLETLLRLQCSLEHQEENRLLMCVTRVARLTTDLQEWEQARLRKKETIWADLGQGNPGSVLQFAELWERAVRAREVEIRRQLQLAEKAREEQLKTYRLARQKRETLESLKEREESVYATEQLRRIQQDLDEMHLARAFYRDNL
jgi:flagellar export protein FliJ